MNNRTLAFVGAALLAAGLFTPMVTMPIVGAINLFANGGNLIAIALLVLAVASAALAAKGRLRDILWPGLAAAGILIFVFARLQYGIGQMRRSIRDSLQDNPFAGMAEGALSAVQFQWGWLVLAAAAGILVYVGLRASKSGDKLDLRLGDDTSKGVAALSLALLLLAPAWQLFANPLPGRSAPATPVSDSAASTTVTAADVDASDPTKEEADYIRDHLQLYALKAKYYDSILDGRVPGVDFKIKNAGARTLNDVEVRVVFHDADGKAIGEESYHPVLVSEYNFSGDNTPLRPNYIWQQDPGQFYAAKGVPTEWKTGAVTASIVDIEFAPEG